MLNFLLNDKVYELQANNQLSTILSQFDANFGIDVIGDILESKFNRFDIVPTSNMVSSFEDNFKELYINFPNDRENIDESREEVYREVIDTICKRYNLEFTDGGGLIDFYSIAYYLYDFFISRFNEYLVKFYCSYIEQEKDNLYSLLKVENNKDYKNNLSKYNYKDEVLGALTNELITVINGIKLLEIPDYNVYKLIYDDENIIALLMNNIYPKTPLFVLFNSILFNPELYPIIITHIRMRLQLLCNNN